MVEVPSTVLMAAEFAKHVDFFSIGTNDLTQYTLAMDRMHAALAKNVDGLHPAILRMIDMTVRGAKEAGNGLAFVVAWLVTAWRRDPQWTGGRRIEHESAEYCGGESLLTKNEADRCAKFGASSS